ncbi:pyocin S6 family toxin immunity protein [Pseudomonas sp. GL-B-19]|uniref:pyocin S6 family toxin immunity protein n=1 Tax=Pseudomonas sp. GL-B-19 TaxID=2832393 RepID=UPI001CBD84F9|nr:pyocin S6 family toxin immunity protein [Pseudomonas sp. GL-B-19]
MIFISITGFYPEPNPDNSLQYEKDVPQALETAVLKVMGWSTLWDVPMGEHTLSPDQASVIMDLVGDPIREDLMYYMGLCSND